MLPTRSLRLTAESCLRIQLPRRSLNMSKVRVAGFAISLDGFSAGTDQSLNDPLGKYGPEIFQWFFHTRTFGAMHGGDGGSTDVDDQFAQRAMDNFGAF